MRLAVATSFFIAFAVPVTAQSQAPLATVQTQARQPVSEQEWTTFVHARLARSAPRAHHRGRREGIVGHYVLRVAFALQPDGSPMDIRISQSSGSKAVDEIGMRIPTLAAPFPAFSPDMAKKPKEIVVPFDFDFQPVQPAPKTAP